jgi:hypothetical protein
MYNIKYYVSKFATGWTGWGLNPGGSKIFCVVQTSPKAHPPSCMSSARSFLEVKQMDHGADNQPPASYSLQMGWSYTRAFFLCLQRHVMG